MGIYLHIPFCKSRCKYCDFFSTTDLEKRSQYVDALLCEWQDAELTGDKIVPPREFVERQSNKKEK